MYQGYQGLLDVTKAMHEALDRHDLEGFVGLVDQRQAVIVGIGDQTPPTAQDAALLGEVTQLDEQIRLKAATAWQTLIEDIKLVQTGKRATTAYFQSSGHRGRGSRSKFIDKVR